jgi:hypothetical protein
VGFILFIAGLSRVSGGASPPLPAWRGMSWRYACRGPLDEIATQLRLLRSRLRYRRGRDPNDESNEKRALPMAYPQLHLRPGRDYTLRHRHPWVFRRVSDDSARHLPGGG